ncbi:MAG: hypothetical protein GEV28_12425 [Actinophytocola sp.]|uniref:hypothetical protein n=1 Tax=Actinophytocola sp. TaxID=1872138 RepID=UPI00132246DE|nr:hypothetical protein [Actinophytocola sp.]MPZ81147.1 hypothetical protein [Actinophytocola sp.]
MLSREEVVAWVAIRYGPRHAEKRASDGGFAFWVDTQPDDYHDGHPNAMTYGNGPCVIVKRTGDVWHLASNPDSLPIYGARSAKELARTMRAAGMNPNIPDETIGGTLADLPDPAARKVDHHAHLVRWLSSNGWQEDAYRIDDRVFAFVVVPTPEISGNGPIFVVKRTAGVWYLGSSPAVHAAAYGARGEAEFYAALLSVVPQADPRQPHDRIPQSYENPF